MNIMYFIRTKFLRRFINMRELSKRNIPVDEIIRLELLVAMCLVALIMGVSYTILGLFLNSYSFLSIANYGLFFITAIPIVLYCIKKGYHNQAKLTMMILGTIFMFIKASSHGPTSGMNLSMLIILFATFAFYSIQDYVYILLSLSILLTAIFLLEVTEYQFLANDLATQQYEYEYNYITTILFCILFFYVILRVNEYINNKLSRLNNKLLMKNKKLAKINEELDTYIYKASHDMRAPLTSLMGIVGLLKIEKNFAEAQQLVQLQENCINKLDDHIKQIINLSRNTKTDLVLDSINLELLVNEVFEELSFFENATNINKSIAIDQRIPLYGDKERLKMVFSNLISNVFKYSRKEDANAEIIIDMVVTKTDATITISDNGIGIAEEHLANIFKMFYRATEKSKGSGLGLYIVYEVIQKLNGSISVSSKLNSYTSFTFTIPNHYSVHKL